MLDAIAIVMTGAATAQQHRALGKCPESKVFETVNPVRAWPRLEHQTLATAARVAVGLSLIRQ